MIPPLRQQFNANFTSEKYHRFLQKLEQHCQTPITFRNCETPCFFARSLLERMAIYGKELIEQLLNSSDYLTASSASIPIEFNAPQETAHPLFVQVDFGLAQDSTGTLQPKLVEIQGFPSLYAYQPVLAQHYLSAYGLDQGLKFLLGDLSIQDYYAMLRQAILGEHDPQNVILMEIDPLRQKTLPDFILTERLCGIKTVCITEIVKEGNHLFYPHKGRRVPIYRIYNRAIADELMRKGLSLSFSFQDPLNVEWAGHPNWFFRISKFSLPYLRHTCVPKTWFLHEVDPWPADLENYVLKPLYSFAGRGVMIGPSREDLKAIPEKERSHYILQERIAFEPVIETPAGPTQAEIRIMCLWVDSLLPGPILVRMGRGKMMGVDHNRDREWVGASVGLYMEENEVQIDSKLGKIPME